MIYIIISSSSTITYHEAPWLEREVMFAVYLNLQKKRFAKYSYEIIVNCKLDWDTMHDCF